jgi:type I restriction enzyme S subunit
MKEKLSLPNNWEWKRLDSVVKTFIVPQRDRPKTFDGNIPWCRIEDIDGIYLSKSKLGLCVSKEVVESMPLRVYPKGTVIVSCSADLGRCAIIANPLITNQTFIGLVPSEKIDSLYLYYLMGSKSKMLNDLATGATIKYLSKNKFQELLIPLPILPEQQRIVAILDEAFAAIAKAKTNAEQNLKNAKELFESYLQGVFENKGDGIDIKTNEKLVALELFEDLKKEKKRLVSSKILLDKKDNHSYPIVDVPFAIPSHWVWCYLSDISLIQEGPGIRKHQYATSGVQFLTVTNILEGIVDLEKSKKFISKEQYKNYSHFTINKGDIVTACSGGSWGKSAIYDLDEKLILNTSTLRLRFYNDLGDNNYLYYLTKTKYFKDSLSKHITGQQPNYGYSHYSKIPIPLPSLPEQQRIVVKLHALSAETKKLEAIYQTKINDLEELKKSLLQKAFNGELKTSKALV